MSSKLQVYASPCLDQVLHQIQRSQHLAPMCSTVTQPSCPAGHQVSQSLQAGPAKDPEVVCLSVCLSVHLSVRLPVCPSSAKTGPHEKLDLSYQPICRPPLASCWTVLAQRDSSCGAARTPAGQSPQHEVNMKPILHASICDTSSHSHINTSVELRAHFTYPHA